MIERLGGHGHSSSSAADARLYRACREFEALLWRQLLREMRKGIQTIGSVAGAEHYQYLADEALAGKLASAGGLGLADLLYRTLRRRL